jgi:hypothetical protein
MITNKNDNGILVAIYGDVGYNTAFSIAPAKLALFRDFIHFQWIAYLNAMYPEYGKLIKHPAASCVVLTTLFKPLTFSQPSFQGAGNSPRRDSMKIFFMGTPSTRDRPVALVSKRPSS